MKFIKKSFLLIFLLITLIYVTNVTSIPKSLILFEGEDLNLKTIFGIYQNKEVVVKTSSNNNDNNIISEETVKISLFNLIDLKKVDVTTIQNTRVVPLGNAIGLKLYANGVLVIGMTEIEGQKPYEKSGIQEGDLIIYINNIQINTTEDLIECVNKEGGKLLKITYLRNGEEHVANIEPVKMSNNQYKLGLWVRDGAAGIGTATYYEPETKKFAALGHGIIDSDTEKLISIESGEVVTTTITNIEKGQEGKPRANKGYNYKPKNNRRSV